MSDLHRLGGLLARWHCWRKHYTPERSFARQGGAPDPEDELEHLLMVSIETQVEALPPYMQRAISQVARAECLGVECDTWDHDHERSMSWLRRGLISAGVL
jgi:hypothetical protein